PFVREHREKRRLSRSFSPDVLRAVVRGRDERSLGSSRRLVTVLFSDLRGFTSISERLEPEQVAAMLREYLTEMTEIVFAHDGAADKYIGDCVMALYNVPAQDPEHAIKAVRTGLAFQQQPLAEAERREAESGRPTRPADGGSQMPARRARRGGGAPRRGHRARLPRVDRRHQRGRARARGGAGGLEGRQHGPAPSRGWRTRHAHRRRGHDRLAARRER